MWERRILGGGQAWGVSFWPFSNSSSWWWLVSSMFLTRTSCHKTTHANGYYSVWPQWVVSVSVLPLTILLNKILIQWYLRKCKRCEKARDFTGKGRPGREQEGKGSQENSSMVMGLVSRLSLANHFDSESFLVVHALFSQDGYQREGFWEVVEQVVSPFDLFWTLLVGGGLLVPCSLPGPPVIKQRMQMVTMVPGQGGRFQSVCFP